MEHLVLTDHIWLHSHTESQGPFLWIRITKFEEWYWKDGREGREVQMFTTCLYDVPEYRLRSALNAVPGYWTLARAWALYPDTADIISNGPILFNHASLLISDSPPCKCVSSYLPSCHDCNHSCCSAGAMTQLRRDAPTETKLGVPCFSKN